ncbi:AAA family ATPase [Shewanella fodinae]|uniref:AAA domain-containing protein n=1 Tax=Shewanella fodinae TaxID=552357 RepID=A0A4R2FKG7_9GAMM|nr:AAA family ATPase [Shewanella fodinae]TCN90540.1 AAA domain-containing protein [Shewanella fodinae]
MFKIEQVAIDGFWYRFNTHCEFNKNVNIIIGRNGSGKTTFMNILHAILKVDFEALMENDFESTTVKLKDQSSKKTKTIKVIKSSSLGGNSNIIEYMISRKKPY